MGRVFLSRGAHNDPSKGLCAMEWVSWAAGEEHSDQPVCVSPVIRQFAVLMNDTFSNATRQKLIPFLLDCIGTNTGVEDDQQRANILNSYGYAMERARSTCRCSTCIGLGAEAMWAFRVSGGDPARKMQSMPTEVSLDILKQLIAVGRKPEHIECMPERVAVLVAAARR